MSPMSAIFAAAVALLAVWGFLASLTRPTKAWMIVVVMVLFSGFAVQVDRSGQTSNQTWVLQLQLARAPLFLAAGCLLFLAMLVHIGKVRLNSLPIQGALMLLIQVLISVLRFNHEGPVAGAQSFVFAIVTILPILLLLPLALKEWDDWMVIIRMLGFSAVIWAGATFVQVLLDHRQLQVNAQERFTGLLGNPQGCGLYMAPLVFTLIWLVMNERLKKLWWIWLGTLSIMAAYCLWTGSRTCILVTGTGTLFVLYSRIGRFVLLLPVLAVVLLAGYQLAGSLGLSSSAVERLVSTQNTRETVWKILLEDAFQNPIFGSGFNETRANENSYLVAFGAYGVFVGTLVLTLLFVSIGLMVRLLRYRKHVPAQHRRIVDLILAFNVAYFLGAMFEWHIVSRMEGNITYLLIFSVMTKQLMLKVDAETSTQELFAEEIEHYGTDDHEGHQHQPLPS
ncbi:MAG: hypothetical protein HEQ23_16920 [Tepidisphaera sp.]